MEVGGRIRVNIAAVADPPLHTTPQRIVTKPGERTFWHVRTPDGDRLIECVVAGGNPTLRHHHPVARCAPARIVIVMVDDRGTPTRILVESVVASIKTCKASARHVVVLRSIPERIVAKA